MKVTVVSRSGREVIKGGLELNDSVCSFFFSQNFLFASVIEGSVVICGCLRLVPGKSMEEKERGIVI